MEHGVFYAVGIGIGDPMDMTLKAKQVLEDADVIIVPTSKKGEKSLAFEIANQVADMSKSKKIELVFPMKSAKDYKEYLTRNVLAPIIRCLDENKTVAMVTLGDVSIYSTATYVRQTLETYGYKTKIIAGITTFIKAAARAGISLCENNESLIMLPGIKTEEALKPYFDKFDTIVIMKAAKALKWLIPFLEKHGLKDNTVMFCNIGMENEYIGPIKNEAAGYFITVIIKCGGLR